MNRALVLRLIVKDWYLNRATLALIAVAGSLSVGILYLRGRDRIVRGAQRGAHRHHLSQHPVADADRRQRAQETEPALRDEPAHLTHGYTTAKILGNLSAFRRALAGDRDRRARHDRPRRRLRRRHPARARRGAGALRRLLPAARGRASSRNPSSGRW